MERASPRTANRSHCRPPSAMSPDGACGDWNPALAAPFIGVVFVHWCMLLDLDQKPPLHRTAFSIWVVKSPGPRCHRPELHDSSADSEILQIQSKVASIAPSILSDSLFCTGEDLAKESLRKSRT